MAPGLLAGRGAVVVGGPQYRSHVTELHRRGLLDEASLRASLDAAPPEYVAPTYAYLVSDLAAAVTGRIFIAAGGFVGELTRPAPGFLGYRDHRQSPPWSVTQVCDLIGGTTGTPELPVG